MEVRRRPLVGARGAQPELLRPGARPCGRPNSVWTGRCYIGTGSTVVIFLFLAKSGRLFRK